MSLFVSLVGIGISATLLLVVIGLGFLAICFLFRHCPIDGNALLNDTVRVPVSNEVQIAKNRARQSESCSDSTRDEENQRKSPEAQRRIQYRTPRDIEENKRPPQAQARAMQSRYSHLAEAHEHRNQDQKQTMVSGIAPKQQRAQRIQHSTPQTMPRQMPIIHRNQVPQQTRVIENPSQQRMQRAQHSAPEFTRRPMTANQNSRLQPPKMHEKTRTPIAQHGPRQIPRFQPYGQQSRQAPAKKVVVERPQQQIQQSRPLQAAPPQRQAMQKPAASANLRNLMEIAQQLPKSHANSTMKRGTGTNLLMSGPIPLVRGSSAVSYTTEEATSITPSEELKLMYEELDIMCNGPEPQAYFVKYYQAAIFELRKVLKRRAIDFERILQDEMEVLMRDKNSSRNVLNLYWAAVQRLKSGESSGEVKRWLRAEISKLSSEVITNHGRILQSGALFN